MKKLGDDAWAKKVYKKADVLKRIVHLSFTAVYEWKFKSSERRNAFVSNPKINFEFDPSNSDNAEIILSENLYLKLNKENINSHFTVHKDEDCNRSAFVSVGIPFDVQTSCDDSEIKRWLAEEAGSFSCGVSSDDEEAELVSSKGEDLYLESNEEEEER